MKYAYFPGCSLASTGKAYELSFRAVCQALGVEIEEIPNWNCCGATAFMSVDEASAYAVSVRNLVLAGQMSTDMVAPCGGCYGILLKAQEYFAKYPEIRRVVSEGLQAEGLVGSADVRVRHPLDLLFQDVGTKAIRAKVKVPLKGLKVACYYGCRFLRPISPFDDQHNPTTMDNMLKAVGARITDFNMKGKCCGGTLAGTIPKIAQDMCYLLLKEAQVHEADVIATACPLCQFNVEAYQDDIIARYPDVHKIPVVFFTQLLGLAMGLSPKEVGFQHQIIPIEPVLRERGILEPKKKEDKPKRPAAAGV